MIEFSQSGPFPLVSILTFIAEKYQHASLKMLWRSRWSKTLHPTNRFPGSSRIDEANICKLDSEAFGFDDLTCELSIIGGLTLHD